MSKEKTPPATIDAIPENVTDCELRRRRYGIYEVAYEDDTSTPRLLSARPLLDGLWRICESAPYAQTLLSDILKLAPGAFITYMMTTVWRSISSAINIYFLSLLFNLLDDRFTSGRLIPEAYRFVALSWVSCTLIGLVVDRINARANDDLCNQLKAHFLPQLIGASLRVDLFTMEDLHRLFPLMLRFESEVPGALFLQELTQLTRCTLVLLSQVAVIVHAISFKRSPDREILMFFCLAHPLIRWLAPSNGIGSSAYVYWTDNQHFKRMKTLFGLTFSRQYRADLMLDGITSSIESEYKKSAERLGHVTDTEPFPWASGLRRSWYWDLCVCITLDLPLAVYALMLPTRFSPSSITSIALLQQATNTLAVSLGECGNNTSSLRSLCSQAKWLYEAINYQGSMPQGTGRFPRPNRKSPDEGMKISFRNVTLRYPGSSRDAIHNMSFDIAPGQLVLIAGGNGNGKSSTLKLLARLFDPTAGEILIDDQPLISYDIDQLRAAMSFMSQSPVVYPASVKENICLGLPPKLTISDEQVERAAQMGGCSEWISRLSDRYETQLQPSFDIDGWAEGVFGAVSEGLKEELARHKVRRTSISGGEKQRLAAARTFMRLNNRDTRLVVVDEATSGLDSVSERDILSEFRKSRSGKTMIFITHQYHHLAEDADQILCMKDDSVIERGTHNDLIRADGEYAKLYNAQAA
ncbi:P-loop containing nucleoside triphosphate hydrolase protein [Paxillus ammoniavirescens]|nr:P-loop containing nucleoside triphosphate hydrolase protein [Paxillus ammoniavirescens]